MLTRLDQSAGRFLAAHEPHAGSSATLRRFPPGIAMPRLSVAGNLILPNAACGASLQATLLPACLISYTENTTAALAIRVHVTTNAEPRRCDMLTVYKNNMRNHVVEKHDV